MNTQPSTTARLKDQVYLLCSQLRFEHQKYLPACAQQKISNALIIAKALDVHLSENPTSTSVAALNFPLAATHSVTCASETKKNKKRASHWLRLVP